ncbi:MAG: hypothetical protein QXQ02_05965 [Halobacteria archaeon]
MSEGEVRKILVEQVVSEDGIVESIPTELILRGSCILEYRA